MVFICVLRCSSIDSLSFVYYVSVHFHIFPPIYLLAITTPCTIHNPFSLSFLRRIQCCWCNRFDCRKLQLNSGMATLVGRLLSGHQIQVFQGYPWLVITKYLHVCKEINSHSVTTTSWQSRGNTWLVFSSSAPFCST